MRRILLGMILCCAAMPALTAEDDIVLRGMGSFHVGGRVAEVSGKPVRMIVRQPGGPLTKLDPNGQYMVEDQDSTNFTFVNRQRLAARTPTPLSDNDEVRLGRVLLRFKTS